MDSTATISSPTFPPAGATPQPSVTRLRLLGECVDLLTPDQVMDHVRAAVSAGRRAVIANHNLNSLNLIRGNTSMRAFYDAAELVQIDSTPLIAFGRLLGLPVRRAHRSTYLDWRESFWAMADRLGWRVLYLGGTVKTGAEAAHRLSLQWPRAAIQTCSGYFDATTGSTGNSDVLARIIAFRPNVLMVGMGMPRQEAWIVANLAALPDCVVMNVGAAFDYEAGVQKAAPRWMGRFGLEWLYRLAHDPQRLFRRYCIEPWSLAGPAFRDVAAALRRRADTRS